MVSDAIFYKFGHEGKAIMEDKWSADVLKMYFKVQEGKVKPKEVLDAFEGETTERWKKTSTYSIYHLVDFIKNLQGTEKEFNTIFTKQSYSVEEFKQVLNTNDIMVSEEDMPKLLEDFMKTSAKDVKGAKANTIYKTTIKRFINIYQPSYLKGSAVTDANKAWATFEDSKTTEEWDTLKRISDYLKHERIDNMSFFATLDTNNDGTVSQ